MYGLWFWTYPLNWTFEYCNIISDLCPNNDDQLPTLYKNIKYSFEKCKYLVFRLGTVNPTVDRPWRCGFWHLHRPPITYWQRQATRITNGHKDLKSLTHKKMMVCRLLHVFYSLNISNTFFMITDNIIDNHIGKRVIIRRYHGYRIFVHAHRVRTSRWISICGARGMPEIWARSVQFSFERVACRCVRFVISVFYLVFPIIMKLLTILFILRDG